MPKHPPHSFHVASGFNLGVIASDTQVEFQFPGTGSGIPVVVAPVSHSFPNLLGLFEVFRDDLTLVAAGVDRWSIWIVHVHGGQWSFS